MAVATLFNFAFDSGNIVCGGHLRNVCNAQRRVSARGDTSGSGGGGDARSHKRGN